MSDEKLIRIFDHNTCLTARQVKGYVSGSMVHEESHAIEAHLLNCPLCVEAVEGVKEHRINGGVEGMLSLTPDFLEGHQGFKNNAEPQTPLSIPKAKIKSTLTSDSGEPKKLGSPQLWRTVSIAATVLIAAGVFWFIQKNRSTLTDTKVAQNVPVAENVTPDPVTTMAPTTALVDSGAMDTSTIGVVNAPPISDTVKTSTVLANDAKLDNAAKKLQADKDKAALAKKEADKKRDALAAKTVTATKKQNVPNNTISGGTGISSDYSTTNKADEISNMPARSAAPTAAPVKPATADELYDQQKYSQALAMYKKEMSTSDGKDKEDAKLGVAKCYIALGNKTQAERLLRGMLYENSKRKRQAKRLLKTIED